MHLRPIAIRNSTSNAQSSQYDTLGLAMATYKPKDTDKLLFYRPWQLARLRKLQVELHKLEPTPWWLKCNASLHCAGGQKKMRASQNQDCVQFEMHDYRQVGYQPTHRFTMILGRSKNNGNVNVCFGSLIRNAQAVCRTAHKLCTYFHFFRRKKKKPGHLLYPYLLPQAIYM